MTDVSGYPRTSPFSNSAVVIAQSFWFRIFGVDLTIRCCGKRQKVKNADAVVIDVTLLPLSLFVIILPLLLKDDVRVNLTRPTCYPPYVTFQQQRCRYRAVIIAQSFWHRIFGVDATIRCCGKRQKVKNADAVIIDVTFPPLLLFVIILPLLLKDDVRG